MNTCKFYSLDGCCLIVKTQSIRAARNFAGTKGYFRRGSPQGNKGYQLFVEGREILRKSIAPGDKHKLETIVLTEDEAKDIKPRGLIDQMEKGLETI